MKRNLIVEIISVLMILLFVYTGVSKIIDYTGFVWKLSRSPLVSAFPVFVSIALPTAEFITSSLLLTVRFKKRGLYASFMLMSLFTLYVAYMLLFSKHLPCSCGGIIQMMTWRQHLIFNICFTALGLLAIYLFNHPSEIQAHKIKES
jgi:putative oxidoreductase